MCYYFIEIPLLKMLIPSVKSEIDDVVLRQIEYADAAKFTVTALLMSDQGHLLSGTDENVSMSIMDRFTATTTELGIDAFWAALHVHFANGNLANASPALLTPFITHLYDKGDLRIFVNYIKYVEIGALDINLLLKLFWSINHFRGIIAIYNLALQDYCSPIEEFVKFIDRKEYQDDDETGHTMLMYFHSSLDGLDMEGQVSLEFNQIKNHQVIASANRKR